MQFPRVSRTTVAAAGATLLVLAIGVGVAAAAGPWRTAGTDPAAATRGYGRGAAATVTTPGTGTVVTPTALTAEQAASLASMADEEKLARDLYAAFAAAYPSTAWDSIGAAESKHLASVRTLLTRYGIADPTATLDAGDFASPALDELYATLLASGMASEDAAFEAGRLVEIDDITKLDAATTGTTASDILRVYSNLRRGSVSHLASFDRLLAL